jgi:hypothetical protein
MKDYEALENLCQSCQDATNCLIELEGDDLYSDDNECSYFKYKHEGGLFRLCPNMQTLKNSLNVLHVIVEKNVDISYIIQHKDCTIGDYIKHTHRDLTEGDLNALKVLVKQVYDKKE